MCVGGCSIPSPLISQHDLKKSVGLCFHLLSVKWKKKRREVSSHAGFCRRYIFQMFYFSVPTERSAQ